MEWNCSYFRDIVRFVKKTFSKTISYETRASFTYYATVRDNLPVALRIRDMAVDYNYSEVKLGPPPKSVFPIPKNCTPSGFKQQIFSNLFFKK